MTRTLFDKIWDAHVVVEPAGEPALLYIDLHLVHEVTSPQAFEGLRVAGRRVRRPDRTVATVDHNLPTTTPRLPVRDPVAARQIDTLRRNCSDFGVTLHDVGSGSQGIVHVIGPELGLTRPGMTIVCGDSHTSTHGAFGALAFGIGTSEVEHVLATQCLPQSRPPTMEIRVRGRRPPGVTAKDLALALIGRIGAAGASGHVVEYTGAAVRELSMEGRMTLCNMSIEAGAHAGMVAPDATTFAYLEPRLRARTSPEAWDRQAWDRQVSAWIGLATDPGAHFDRCVEIDAGILEPQVTWGTTPAMVAPISGKVPGPAAVAPAAVGADGGRSAGAGAGPVTRPDAAANLDARRTCKRALAYMGLEPGIPIADILIDRVFIGSCTNGRLEDLRAAARVARGHRVHSGVRAIVVPGSEAVKQAAEAEGLDAVFREAGFEWRQPGCSMCLGMNPDVLGAGERCASTSNRNFEGRQGRGGRTHLVSPAMAAAAAIAGHFTDVRSWRFRGEAALEPAPDRG